MPDLDYPIHILGQLIIVCAASLAILSVLYLCVHVIKGIYEEITSGKRRH